MEVGMSLACFYPMEPERALDEAAALDIRVCEIFLNTFSELDESYLHFLRDACDQKGIAVYSVHPFTSFLENYLFFSPYPRRVADATELYRHYAKAADILGAKVVNIHGDRGIGLESVERYVELINPLRTLQDETGIVFSMENVYYNSVDHPEFTARLRQLAPDVRFTLDIKQAFKGGQDPYALAEAMGDAVVNFHVNDRDEQHICMLPGQGLVDYTRIGSILKHNNYAGPALIEVYSSDFKSVHEITCAKKFLESKLTLAN